MVITYLVRKLVISKINDVFKNVKNLVCAVCNRRRELHMYSVTASLFKPETKKDIKTSEDDFKTRFYVTFGYVTNYSGTLNEGNWAKHVNLRYLNQW